MQDIVINLLMSGSKFDFILLTIPTTLMSWYTCHNYTSLEYWGIYSSKYKHNKWNEVLKIVFLRTLSLNRFRHDFFVERFKNNIVVYIYYNKFIIVEKRCQEGNSI